LAAKPRAIRRMALSIIVSVRSITAMRLVV
jgi:hypothetical protein